MLVAWLGLLVCGSPAALAAEDPAIEPFALRVLERMSGFVADAKGLAYDAVTETVEVAPGGLPTRLRAEARVAARRPDRLYVDILSDEVHRRFTLGRQRVRLHDVLADAYAVAEAPGGVEETLDLLEDKLGVFVPLGYVLRRDPLASIMEGVLELSYGGLDDVAGISCHYLAARQDDMAWEVWVEVGPQPVPRKLVFHFADEGGTTTYTALVEAWVFDPHLPDEGFAPPVADSAREVPLREMSRGGE
jgi:hypothetical protein